MGLGACGDAYLGDIHDSRSVRIGGVEVTDHQIAGASPMNGVNEHDGYWRWQARGAAVSDWADPAI